MNVYISIGHIPEAAVKLSKTKSILGPYENTANSWNLSRYLESTNNDVNTHSLYKDSIILGSKRNTTL